ncbi:MAG: PilN domain-containing protein [Proteobacteria bacterium]|uniref:PilN domain-containing protein n=1 Tax=Rudaea sp. TaxID=2136325 RepID=UPI001DEA9676|nr:PilN domain-containing protein [Pseudomonadota bacterium]MBS0566331.1 PilN domain-containing protein [Pseudomonadota bacterium]
MATINLLPWRAERRRQRERDFYTMLAAAAILAVLSWLAWGWWMDQRISDQDARNGYLSSEIKQLEGKLKEIKDLETTKAKLLARKQIIEQLQASRAQMVHLFDELVRTIPEGVRLTALKQTGNQLAMQGVAQANGDVANYMRNLDASAWMQRSDLQKTEIKGTDKRNRYEFGLTVKLRSPDQPDADAPPGSAPAKPGAAPPAPSGNPSTRAPASAAGAP